MSFTANELLGAQDLLRAYCIKATGSKHNGEDLCQRVLLKALEKRDSYVPQNLNAWLITIARNLNYTDFRRNRRMDVTDPHVLEATSGSGPTDGPLHKIDLEKMFKVIERLPESFRESLLLAAKGYDYQEAADILGIKLGTYKSRLSRARGALVESFENPSKPIRTRSIKVRTEKENLDIVQASKPPPAPIIEKHIEILDVAVTPAPKTFDEAELAARLQIPRSKIHAALVKSGKELAVNPVFNTSVQSYIVNACNMADLCGLFQIPERSAHPSYMTPSDASVQTGIQEGVLRAYFDDLVREKKKHGYATIGGKSAVSIVHAYDERAEAVVPMIPAIFSSALTKAIS